MRLPFSRRQRSERRAVAFSDAVANALYSEATVAASLGARQTGALETCAGLWARAFAGCSVSTSPLTPDLMAIVGRELVRRGEALLLIDASDRVLLVPAASWDVRGRSVDEDRWRYRCYLQGPERTTTRYVSGDMVLHFRYGVEASRPWLGRSPMAAAAATGALMGSLEAKLGQEAAGVVAHVLPIPVDPGEKKGADEDYDPLGDLKQGLRDAKGSTMFAETTAAGWKQGATEAPPTRLATASDRRESPRSAQHAAQRRRRVRRRRVRRSRVAAGQRRSDRDSRSVAHVRRRDDRPHAEDDLCSDADEARRVVHHVESRADRRRSACSRVLVARRERSGTRGGGRGSHRGDRAVSVAGTVESVRPLAGVDYYVLRRGSSFLIERTFGQDIAGATVSNVRCRFYTASVPANISEGSVVENMQRVESIPDRSIVVPMAARRERAYDWRVPTDLWPDEIPLNLEKNVPVVIAAHRVALPDGDVLIELQGLIVRPGVVV